MSFAHFKSLHRLNENFENYLTGVVLLHALISAPTFYWNYLFNAENPIKNSTSVRRNAAVYW